MLERKAGTDGFVRFDKSRYSLPPQYAGQTVFIGRQEQKVIIRAKDMIVAEHLVAHKAGSTVADPAHLAELWKLSLDKPQAPPPRWQLTFDAQVQSTPLSEYQEAAQ